MENKITSLWSKMKIWQKALCITLFLVITFQLSYIFKNQIINQSAVVSEKTVMNSQPNYNQIPRFVIEGSRTDIFDKIQDLGFVIRESHGAPFVKWGTIEPNAPINGVSTYVKPKQGDWWITYLKQIKDSGVDFSVSMETDNSKWALSTSTSIQVINPGTGKKMPGLIKIKPEYEGAYKNFIKYYIKETPNLKYIQVDSEPENIWVNGEGYYREIELTKEAVTEYNIANRTNIKIMAAGFNLPLNIISLPEDVKYHMYKNHPNIDHTFIRTRINEELTREGEKPVSQNELTTERINMMSQKLHVVMTVLNRPNPAMDILAIHLDQANTYDYGDKIIDWYKTQMKNNGYDRPLWIDDMSHGYILNSESEEDKILLQGLERNDPKIIKEYNKRQSAWSLRKIVGHFSHGAEKLKIAFDMDIDYYLPKFNSIGMFSLNGKEKPSYYSAKIIIDKLDYFKTATRINLNTGDYLYKFTFENKPYVYIAWTEPKTKTGNEDWNFETIKTIDLSKEIQGENVEIIYLVNTVDTKNQPITKSNKVVSVKQVPLSSEPIFISPTLSTPTVITGCVFDHIKYANHYPDLKTAYGSDKAKLTDHWLNSGIKEGRTPCGADMPTCKFDNNDYLTMYPDVATFGLGATFHYKKWGVNEGRAVCQTSFTQPPVVTPNMTSCVFDHIKYANYYPDLKTAYGSDKAKLTDHWLKYGIKEGRTPCGADMSTCKADSNNYLAMYPDVAASGLDPLVHYKKWGINEERAVCKN